MKREQAKKIVGRNRRHNHAMARALQIHHWRNTPEEWLRLAALKSLGFRVVVEIPEPYRNISEVMEAAQ